MADVAAAACCCTPVGDAPSIPSAAAALAGPPAGGSDSGGGVWDLTSATLSLAPAARSSPPPLPPRPLPPPPPPSSSPSIVAVGRHVTGKRDAGRRWQPRRRAYRVPPADAGRQDARVEGSARQEWGGRGAPASRRLRRGWQPVRNPHADARGSHDEPCPRGGHGGPCWPPPWAGQGGAGGAYPPASPTPNACRLVPTAAAAAAAQEPWWSVPWACGSSTRPATGRPTGRLPRGHSGVAPPTGKSRPGRRRAAPEEQRHAPSGAAAIVAPVPTSLTTRGGGEDGGGRGGATGSGRRGARERRA